LTESQREAMNAAGDEIFEEYFAPDGFQTTAALKACDALEQNGGTLTKLPDDLTADWEGVAAPANVKRFLEIAGPDGQEFLDEWEKSLKEMEKKYSAYVDPSTT